MTWNEVLKRDDLVDGDLETVEDNLTYRGPIQRIVRMDHMVYITLTWVAVMPQPGQPGFGEWRVHSSTGHMMAVNVSIPPQDNGDGRVNYSLPGSEYTIIFPKGGSKLDPNDVFGLVTP